MIQPSHIWRLLQINRILLRHGLDEIVLATRWFRPVRWVWFLLPWNWVPRTRRPRGERIRRALEDLGPVFVKFGQTLSTRRDLLPADIAAELARLQDRVPPFPGVQAREIIAAAFEAPLEQHFARFDDAALASASIAQVHTAQLHSGEEVVVKVLRPRVEQTIRRDVSLLYLIADLTQRYWSEGRRLRPREVVAEYERTIFDELDLIREAANVVQTRRNFEGNPVLYVPDVHWELTRRNVMVMERIDGVSVSDLQTLRERKVDLKRLAELGVEIFFTQVFHHNFFHADMHPGNIFVDTSNPAHPAWMAVDFGIVGTLSPSDQHYLAHNLLAFFNRDYRRVAELHVESGWVPADTRVDDFESAVRTVCEPIFNRPLKEISFGHLLLRLFQTARRFNMEVQPQLVLLQKTLLHVEGLGRELYPDLDLWQTAKPYLERWMGEQVGVRSVLKRFRRHLPEVMQVLPELPLRLDGAMRQLETLQSQQQRVEHRLVELREQSRRNSRRGLLGLAGAALLLSSALIFGLQAPPGAGFMDVPPAAWLTAGTGLLALAFAWFGTGD